MSINGLVDTITGQSVDPETRYEPAQTAASQAEMEAGTESAIRSMSPLRVAQAIAELATGEATGFDWADGDIQTFTSSGTWTKPTGDYSWCEFYLVGGGGGGGSGAVSISSTLANGGGGGGGGAAVLARIPFADAPSSATITIGAGGSGGAAQTDTSSFGNVGTAGGVTSFGSVASAFGGHFGYNGRSSDPTIWQLSQYSCLDRAAVGFPAIAGVGGTPFSATNTQPPPTASVLGGGGGAGGSPITSGGSVRPSLPGAAGSPVFVSCAGGTAGTSGSRHGGAGTAAPTSAYPYTAGAGGGGGFGFETSYGGNGGAGGYPGGGGGGGAAALDSNDSGAGGDGAKGYARIRCF